MSSVNVTARSLGFLLPGRELQWANTEAYRIPLVQVFKLFKDQFYEFVMVFFGHR